MSTKNKTIYDMKGQPRDEPSILFMGSEIYAVSSIYFSFRIWLYDIRWRYDHFLFKFNSNGK